VNGTAARVRLLVACNNVKHSDRFQNSEFVKQLIVDMAGAIYTERRTFGNPCLPRLTVGPVEQMNDVGFEVLTAAVMQSSILCYIETGMKQVASKPLLATCFHAGFLLGLFFEHEDGGDVFLRTVD
jgi:hypothetical protein